MFEERLCLCSLISLYRSCATAATRTVLTTTMKRVVILGSGNWGTTAALLVANNLLNKPGIRDFDTTVKVALRRFLLCRPRSERRVQC